VVAGSAAVDSGTSCLSAAGPIVCIPRHRSGSFRMTFPGRAGRRRSGRREVSRSRTWRRRQELMG
jgi:hypothetical protein